MNYFDPIMLIILIVSALVGFKRGVFKSVITLIGTILIFVVAFYLKNPVATLMFENLPFIGFKGTFAGLTTLNILVYEGLAFLAVSAALALALRIILLATKLLDLITKVLSLINLTSKVLGFVVGIVEGFLIIFAVLFITSQFSYFDTGFAESKYATRILEETPFLSSIVKDTFNSVTEIYNLKMEYDDSKDKDEFNRKALDVLLKNKIITVESTDILIKKNKLKIDDIESIVDKYRK